ncbi:hypothetical protein [Bacillus sp. T3]|uniref:hypothetical protein n=1 Tax=Bacillus sp. T3 TaxID=467262 RepID=UPI00298136A3|nr:hypothetical protein [Bacillus sp. T3]
MKLALVLAEQKEIIVPIVEGTVIRIYDTETRQYEDYENPALSLQSGKRGAIIRWLNERGINLLVTPPNTLCELSYEAAQKEEFHYYRVEAETNFTYLRQLIDHNQLLLTDHLPESEIQPSHIPTVDEQR